MIDDVNVTNNPAPEPAPQETPSTEQGGDVNITVNEPAPATEAPGKEGE